MLSGAFLKQFRTYLKSQVGQELIQIKEADKFLSTNFPDIAKGITTPVTQKTFKYQKPIP